MKIVRSLFLSAILVLTAAMTAFASPEAPTDQEVAQAFQEANTVTNGSNTILWKPTAKRKKTPDT